MNACPFLKRVTGEDGGVVNILNMTDLQINWIGSMKLSFSNFGTNKF